MVSSIVAKATSGSTIQNSKRGPETIDFAESRGRGLVIKLTALAEIGHLVEILSFEQGRRSLAGARRQNRRIHQPEFPVVKKIPDRFHDFGPDLEDGVLFTGSKPEMAMFHQKRRRMLLGGDRIILGDLEDLDLGDGEFETSGGAFVLPDPAPDDQRRFLRQGLESGKKRIVVGPAEDRRLEEARPVPDKEEADPTARSGIINPAPDFDVLVPVSRNVLDVNPFHGR
jgi:hypothetical protein